MCHRGSCVLPHRDEGDRTRKTQRQRETDVTAATHNQGKGEIQEPVGGGGGEGGRKGGGREGREGREEGREGGRKRETDLTSIKFGMCVCLNNS